MNDYLASFRDPAAIHASCCDYLAGWAVDRLHDEADRDERKIIIAPFLVLWGRDGAVDKSDPLKMWSGSASNIQGQALPGGHFVPEESPEEMAHALLNFFSAA